MPHALPQNDAAVQVVSYDPAWPARFAEEERLLASVLRQWLVGPIEHIGSTAVPGLAAKPIIDIMAPVVSLDASHAAIQAVAAANYVHFPYKPHLMHWFCKPSPAMRTPSSGLAYGQPLKSNVRPHKSALARTTKSHLQFG